jgi:hypothetical protein
MWKTTSKRAGWSNTGFCSGCIGEEFLKGEVERGGGRKTAECGRVSASPTRRFFIAN